jgi:hypothetical protein
MRHREQACKVSMSGGKNMSPNLSIDADPQHQEAASPLMLVGRSFLR